MSENKKYIQLNKLVKHFNVSIDKIFAFLETKGIRDLKPTTKVSYEVYMELVGEFIGFRERIEELQIENKQLKEELKKVNDSIQKVQEIEDKETDKKKRKRKLFSGKRLVYTQKNHDSIQKELDQSNHMIQDKKEKRTGPILIDCGPRGGSIYDAMGWETDEWGNEID